MSIETIAHAKERTRLVSTARIVQEVMRDDYGMPDELAEQLEYILIGAMLCLDENGYDGQIQGAHVDVGGDESPYAAPCAVIKMSPMEDGSQVVFEIHTMLEVEDAND